MLRTPRLAPTAASRAVVALAFLGATVALAGCARPPEGGLNQPIRQGTVDVTLVRVEAAHLDLETATGSVRTGEPVLLVHLKVANAGPDPLTYNLAWDVTSATQAQTVLLFTDPGPEGQLGAANAVPLVSLGTNRYLADPVTAPTTVAAGASLDDVLLFRMPPAGQSNLVLSIPPHVFGPTTKLPAYIRFPFTAPAEHPAPTPTPQGTAHEGQGWALQVDDAALAWVRLSDTVQGDGFSDTPLLRIGLAVRNTGEGTIAWQTARQAGPADPILLLDGSGTAVAAAQFGANVRPQGVVDGRKQLGAGESFTDVLLFERPRTAGPFTLVVPGKRAGGTGIARLAVTFADAEPPLPAELVPPPEPAAPETAPTTP